MNIPSPPFLKKKVCEGLLFCLFFEISPYNVSMFNKTDKETIVNNSLSLALNYQGNQIRTAGTRENPLFCAKDVCDILGIKNTSQALLKVDKDAIRIS